KMKTQNSRFLLSMVFISASQLVCGQSLFIPQIADGGGWQTTLVLANTSASSAIGSLTFFQETTGGATQRWSLPFLETGSTENLALPAGGTLFLHTAGTAAVTAVGWGQLQGSSAISAYAIFTQRVLGRLEQDGTSLATGSATRFLVPFDNTNG